MLSMMIAAHTVSQAACILPRPWTWTLADAYILRVIQHGTPHVMVRPSTQTPCSFLQPGHVGISICRAVNVSELVDIHVSCE